MNGLKKCKQCGEVKSETLFREYYGRGANKGQRTGGRFKTCKDCEAINNRLKYLTKKDVLTEVEQAEVDTYEKLYEVQRSLGFKPPATQGAKEKSTVSIADQMMAKYANMKPVDTGASHDMPLDEIPGILQQWLTKEFSGLEPDELRDQFDKLEAKYRPQTGLDNDLVPVYDNTYKSVLDKIEDRIDDYEDDYYME